MKTIFLDMDGVLVDLVAGAKELVDYRNPWPPGEYDLRKVLDPHIWSLIAQHGKSWWLHLNKTEESDAIVEIVEKYNFYFCSIPASPDSAAGKLSWLQRHYPKLAKRYVLTPEKQLLAYDNLLIDDSSENCIGWRNAGGYTYLVPRPWNCAYLLTVDLDFLESYVTQFMESP